MYRSRWLRDCLHHSHAVYNWGEVTQRLHTPSVETIWWNHCVCHPLQVQHTEPWLPSNPYVQDLHKIINQFFQKSTIPRSKVDHLNVRQWMEEQLSNFMLRSINETLRFNISSDDLIILASQNGLIVGPLYMELCKNPLAKAQSMWKLV